MKFRAARWLIQSDRDTLERVLDVVKIEDCARAKKEIHDGYDVAYCGTLCTHASPLSDRRGRPVNRENFLALRFFLSSFFDNLKSVRHSFHLDFVVVKTHWR